jgi:hypothetical protein
MEISRGRGDRFTWLIDWDREDMTTLAYAQQAPENNGYERRFTRDVT